MINDLKLMEHAVALAEHGNFGRAARALRLTQSALTRSIQELERRLAIRLFERTRSGVEATDAGLLFIDRARGLIVGAHDLEHEINLMRGADVGELHIGTATYPAETIVGEAVARTLHAHPGIRMRVVMDHWGSQMSMLRRREIDISVASLVAQQGKGDVKVRPLSRHQAYFVVRPAHPLLRVGRPTLADIVAFPLVSTGRLSAESMTVLLRAFPAAQKAPRRHARVPAIGCESMTLMRTIAAGSDAVAIVTLLPSVPDIRAGRLAILPLIEPTLFVDFGIFSLESHAPSLAVSTFIDVVSDVDREINDSEMICSKELLGGLALQ
jgi:DNA-binding transcriptional LysR family regulator